MDTGDDKRWVDFWILQANRDALLVIDAQRQTYPFTIGDVEFAVRTILPVELAAARIWIDNWTTMLPAIVSCHRLMPESFLRAVLKSITEPMQLSRIETELGTSDVSLVRAAVFTLLHHGQLQAPCLHTEPLSFLTCFEPVRRTP